MADKNKALKKVVIALGGNALENKKLPPTAESQLIVVKGTCELIADISCSGYELAIVHGNGPQVGRILLASEAAADVTPSMPFDVCGAMSQGYIGYHIQQGLKKALSERGSNIPVVTVITQVAVDKNDSAFNNPTKPIGLFYTQEQAEKLSKEKGFIMKEDAGRGFRRTVPSPKPKKILEINTIKTLWNTTITVTCGGGGIPVIENEDGSVKGVAAVIDKDLAAECLAEGMDADILMILTEVENVYINFNTPSQQKLEHISTGEAEKYLNEGHFAVGSMKPKVEAAIAFARSKPGRKSIITSLFSAADALAERTGTLIYD